MAQQAQVRLQESVPAPRCLKSEVKHINAFSCSREGNPLLEFHPG